MNRSPYFLIFAGLFFFGAAFYIPKWIFSKNPLHMIQDDMQEGHLVVIADYIAEYYVTPVDRTQLMRNAVKGMTYDLDPWSKYIEPESSEKLGINDLSGSLVGIGIYWSPMAKSVQVIKVLPGGPAEKAGVKKGDIFIQVDKYDVSEWINLHKLQKVVRGKKGSKVVIKFFRPKIKDYVTLTLIRDRVEIPSVTSKMLAGNVLYINLSQFHARSDMQIKKTLDAHPKAKAIIFDLRDNGGGVLSVTANIASYFLPKGTVVVKVQGRRDSTDLKTQIEGKWKDTPLAVLINGYSASASEVLAGCFQDHGRAVIWGEKSFGKALVQNVYDLEGGKSSLKLTTARYLTPKGHFIQRSVKKPYGIVPDKAFTYDSYSNEYYLQKMKAAWKKLGIKKEFKQFIKENPPSRQDIEGPDPLVKEVLKHFNKK